MSIDDAFGYWLAGFVDGEGCFVIKREPGGGRYACNFKLALRLDDASIIRDIYQRTGIGQIYLGKPRGNTQASIRWMVTNKHDCLRLIGLLQRFPLRSKKQRDFQLWVRAVTEWVGHKHGESWTVMAWLHDRLQAIRAFESTGEIPAEAEGVLQLGLGVAL